MVDNIADIKDNESVKVIVTDFDGTLADRSGRVPQRNLDAIMRFVSKGGYFTLATGRVVGAIKNIVPSITELVNVPIITLNGTLICDVKTEEIVSCTILDGRYAASAIRDAKEKFPLISVSYVCDLGIFDFFDGGCGSAVPSECWYKFTMSGAKSDIDGAMAFVKSRYGCGFKYTKSCDTFSEYLDRRASKGRAIEKLRRYMEKTTGKKAYIYAVGDFLNDEEMLGCADFSACPSNAHEYIKTICDAVLCGNDDGVLGDLIENVIGV